ncbi:MAG: Flp pilus assembly protein CpaB [Steroidobacteraceae bacterium]|jgi:pilus assembly protein CpaB|nr:Flp pilus assembly protein CpaB [Steroidobacteraceae bacterium]
MLQFPKLSSTWLLAALALAAGGTAFWATQRFLADSSAGVRRQWEARYALRPVLVAARDLTAGQTLVDGDLARREMPAGFLPSTTLAATDVDRALGQRLAVSLRAGDPVGEASLEARVPALSRRLPEGSRAVTVPVDQVSSQAGLVRPGDRVDLMLAEERIEGAERCVVVRSLLESVHVLATGQATREALGPGEAQVDLDTSYSTITLDVTPEQAQQLAVGLRLGELIPMLRGAGDEAPTGLEALGDGRLACRGVARGEVEMPARAAPRRIAVDVLVGGRQPGGFARLWVPENDL